MEKNLEENNKINTDSLLKWILIAFAACMIVSVVYFIFINYVYDYFWSSLGNASNKFDAANALFAGFAFALFFIAILMQRKELKIQRYELQLTRKEMKDNRAEMHEQTEQFEKQNINIEIQKFETTFFNMINLANSFYNANQDDKSNKIYTLYLAVINNYDTENKILLPLTELQELPNKAAEYYYNRSRKYYDIIIEIIRLLDRNVLIQNRKNEYFKILIAVLHHPELLFFEGLKSINIDAKMLIEEFGILQRIEDTFFTFIKYNVISGSIDDVKNLYKLSAYEKFDGALNIPISQLRKT